MEPRCRGLGGAADLETSFWRRLSSPLFWWRVLLPLPSRVSEVSVGDCIDSLAPLEQYSRFSDGGKGMLFCRSRVSSWSTRVSR